LLRGQLAEIYLDGRLSFPFALNWSLFAIVCCALSSAQSAFLGFAYVAIILDIVVLGV
jgi:hypothetical protein